VQPLCVILMFYFSPFLSLLALTRQNVLTMFIKMRSGVVLIKIERNEMLSRDEIVSQLI
jgi:hypothetical protein